MAYYYNKINQPQLAELVVRAGRAGHQIRNLTQGFVNLGYPELLTIDTISGQVEGQCRALRAQIQNKNDLKPTLRNAIRPTVFLQSVLTGPLPQYMNEINKQDLNGIKALVELMRVSLKEVDTRVNLAILKDSLESFHEQGLPEIPLEKATPEQVLALDNEFEVTRADELKVEGSEGYPRFKEANQRLARLICNKAHQMQDLASVWNQTKPQNEQTNKIINLAGQVENQSRDVQAKLQNYGRVHQNKEAVINGIKQNTDKMVELVTQIEQVAGHVNCPLKLAGGGPFEMLYQVMVELWQTLKTNNERGFAAH